MVSQDVGARKRAWVFADKITLPKSHFPSGMYACVDEECGSILVHSEGGMEVLYSIRRPVPLSVYQVLKYPVGTLRAKLLADEALVEMTKERASQHSSAARWVAMMIPPAIREELIEKGHRRGLPDKVYESLTHRSILVIYGTHRFTFFRGDREKELSPEKPAYDVISDPRVPARELHGKALVYRDDVTLQLARKARSWAERVADAIPRVADKDHIARRKKERQQEMSL